MNLYVELFHGRHKADEQLDDWGFGGPVVGPMHIGWTYGQIKFCDDGGDVLHLPQREDMIHLQVDGKDEFYGDMAVIDPAEPNSAKWLAENKDRVISLDDFKAKYNLTF